MTHSWLCNITQTLAAAHPRKQCEVHQAPNNRQMHVSNAHHDLVRALGQRPGCVAQPPHAIVGINGCATRLSALLTLKPL